MKSLSDILSKITPEKPTGPNRSYPRCNFDDAGNIRWAIYLTYSNPSFMQARKPYLPSKFLKQSANICLK